MRAGDNAKLVAIDFEIADYGADSACALGIVTIERGTIVRSACRLIRPPRRDFAFTFIHGITWNDVEDEAVFAEVWDGLRGYWQGAEYFVAHSAAFDRRVLAACSRAAGRAPPDVPFVCTVKIARAHWNFRPARLPVVCARLGIALRHHDAASDALASASIALRAMSEGYPIDAAVISRVGGRLRRTEAAQR
ncbi:MAG TPA: exonuclease domain-containing protein [Alphaproteobacteria bacterium]|nr:exonuclease domain-containing protein [Alphaproteobacteria bacterium]